jgi:ribonuclease D
MTKNDEARMTNDEGSPNARTTKGHSETSSHSDLVIPSSLDLRHSSLPTSPIASAAQLAELVSQIEPHGRVAIDTEADSLHCYREKLCLLQISLPGEDYVIDPLAGTDLLPLSSALASKEIVLHGSDFDLRLLRRAFDFRPQRIFDTVIASRLLGIKEFSLAALVQRYFGVELSKGSQKANWAQRPLPQRMVEYAINDTHYLLSMAGKVEEELSAAGRLDWFHQSCQRALEQAAIDRVRDADEAWRISGSGKLRDRAAALLRELWRWRESEAEAVDRPPFHILQNQELIRSAERFASGGVPDYRHFSPRRRQAFLDAAERALQVPEADWPVSRRRFGNRPSDEIVRRAEELRQRRDRITGELGLEPAFVAPRSTLEAIAADPSCAGALLVQWQRQLLELE